MNRPFSAKASKAGSPRRRAIRAASWAASGPRAARVPRESSAIVASSRARVAWDEPGRRAAKARSAAATICAACAGSSERVQIAGSVWHRERIALAPRAVQAGGQYPPRLLPPRILGDMAVEIRYPGGGTPESQSRLGPLLDRVQP